MKKLLSIAMCFVLIVSTFTLIGVSASADTDGYYTYYVSNGEATITDCNESISGDITIPSTLGGYPVTNIGMGAFDQCRRLTTITIPDSVTSICENAFRWCSSLEEITIPNSVISIDKSVFVYCSALTNISIPDGIININDFLFCACYSLKKVILPASVKYIGVSAFSGCVSLEYIYYEGDNSSWKEISIGAYNNSLLNANIEYNHTHSYSLCDVKTATYFADGYTGDMACVKCGIVTAKGKAIAKLTLQVPKFKLVKGKKLFKVKYTAVTGATGFQVRYKLKGKWKLKTFDTKKTATKVIKKLKKGNYQVQIRAFVKQGKQKAYSAWSKTQKVKVK